MGHTDNVRSYFALADVVALPSLSEAFGMSILEGMACGLPVVTSSNAGISSLITDGVNGFAFDDKARLREILPGLSDPVKRERIGAQARMTAEEHTWQATADEYEKLFFQIAKRIA